MISTDTRHPFPLLFISALLRKVLAIPGLGTGIRETP
jgi:hypothetical protein